MARRGPARPTFALGLIVLLVVLSAISLCAGGRATSPFEVARALAGGGDPYVATIVEARASRTVVGILVGAALALAGVLIQGITHNPLADPGLLGITSGSSAAVVTACLVTGTTLGQGTIWAAVAGALITTAVVYAVSTTVPERSIVTLLLTGAVISAVLTAYINVVILLRPRAFDTFRFWVVGSLSGRDWEVAGTVVPVLGAGFLIAILLISGLNNLALGEEVASSLGTPVVRVRAAGIFAAALLAGGATAATGPLVFIGLAVPHLLRALIGHDHRWLVPLAALGGANLVVLADILARLVARPEEILVGIVTSFLGAPLLLLAVRQGVASR